jgi:predicted nucleotidyltransferase
MDTFEKQIISVLKRYGIKKAALFGSYARGDYKNVSDVDILVDLPKGISLITYISIKQDLEDLLQKKVDLVDYSTLKPLIRESVLADQKMLFS